MGRVHAWKLPRCLFRSCSLGVNKPASSVGAPGWSVGASEGQQQQQQQQVPQPPPSMFDVAQMLVAGAGKKGSFPLRYDISDAKLCLSGPLGTSSPSSSSSCSAPASSSPSSPVTKTGADQQQRHPQQAAAAAAQPQFICRVLAQSSEEGIRGIYISQDGAIMSVEGDLQTRVWASVRETRAQLLRFKRPHSYSICVNTFSLQKAGVTHGSGDAGNIRASCVALG